MTEMGLSGIGTWVRRKMRARRLGIPFSWIRDFELPGRILLGGLARELRLPAGNGVRVAFIDILLDDCYGLRPLAERVKTVLDIGAQWSRTWASA